ncbi:hypothetical protein DVH24_021573 [Malus domestica]|uniref:Uncharacterized protein n=1 Tax=Malus domestica TaxID=3750 RepID=A0A498K3D7_MALDO|nr:hypothetical protein DVH24_021573 [Malus domestica]
MQNHLALVSTLKYREHIMYVAKFPSLSLGGFSLRFSLYGDEANCLLECNEDIQTLLLVNNLICNLDVEVYFHDKNEMSIVSNSCALSFGSSETTIEFCRKITQYCIEVGFVLKYIRNYWKHVTAICSKKLSECVNGVFMLLCNNLVVVSLLKN